MNVTCINFSRYTNPNDTMQLALFKKNFLLSKARYILEHVENCDVDVPYVCKYLDVDELNVSVESLGLFNHVSCLSLNCRNIIAFKHFELIVQFCQVLVRHLI